MKVIEPSVEFITPMSAEIGKQVMERIELAGRVCYKSEEKITEDSAEKFIRNIIKRGHESVLEHCAFTVRFTVDRGVSHEIVRHRIASYSQESTRYCNYGGDDIVFIKPCFWDKGSEEYHNWEMAMCYAEGQYKYLQELGATPQEARSVLPNSLKTEVVMTANLREWRHFLFLRTAKAAHPQMREVACQLLAQVKEYMPGVFGDIDPEN